MIRGLAGWDPERVRALRASPLRDVLYAAEERVRQREIDRLRHEQALYFQGGLKRAPEAPGWMKED